MRIQDIPKEGVRRVLRSLEILKAVIGLLQALYEYYKRDQTKAFEVIIRPYRKNRSLAQNNLMWLWLTRIAREYAHARDEKEDWYDPKVWKEEFQSKFLGYRVVNTPSGERPHLIGTSELNTAAFSAFLNDIEHYAGSALEISLPHPEDIYYEAMGLKEKEQ